MRPIHNLAVDLAPAGFWYISRLDCAATRGHRTFNLCSDVVQFLCDRLGSLLHFGLEALADGLGGHAGVLREVGNLLNHAYAGEFGE